MISFNTSFTHSGTLKNLIGENPSEELVKHFSNELMITDKSQRTFLVHAADDRVVPVKNSIVYFEGLVINNIPCELHVFQKGGHGFGLACNNRTESA